MASNSIIPLITRQLRASFFADAYELPDNYPLDMNSEKQPIIKLTIEETARAMAAANEDLSEWDVTIGDGLDDMPWDPAASRQTEADKDS